jgi:hypothetical protein
VVKVGRKARMNPDTAPEVVIVRLPSYLARWLREFADDLAMTPDQLLANILNYYYEAWRIGFRKAFEKHCGETSASSSLHLIKEDTLGEPREICG